jgi:hypothetical protein
MKGDKIYRKVHDVFDTRPGPDGLPAPAWLKSYLYDVGILADGTLYNPHRYDEDLVRNVIAAAEARKRERRSKGAKRAAETRAQHRELDVARVAQQIRHNIGPLARSHCAICGRELTDPLSIGRGVGPECWEYVMQVMDKQRIAGMG